MSLPDLLLQHLSDPFRIALLIALFVTMLRTQAATGTVMPLALGAVFVAVLIPYASQNALAAPMAMTVGVGLVANAMLLVFIFAAWMLYKRLRG